MDLTDFQDPSKSQAPVGTTSPPMPGSVRSVSQPQRSVQPPPGVPPQKPTTPPPGALPQKPVGPPDGFAPSGERKETVAPQKERVFKEKVPIVEVGVPKEVGPEVKDWMEKLETGEEIQLPQPVIDDTTGQVIVEATTPQKVEIKLPLTEAGIQQGLHREIVESIRWLAEWCRRLLKIVGKKFFYRIKDRDG